MKYFEDFKRPEETPVKNHHQTVVRKTQRKGCNNLARELKKMWNRQVTIIPIVIGAFRTVTKGLLRGLEVLEVGGWVGTIQMTALLRTAKILRRVLET